jgi:hypothetical protein
VALDTVGQLLAGRRELGELLAAYVALRHHPGGR